MVPCVVCTEKRVWIDKDCGYCNTLELIQRSPTDKKHKFAYSISRSNPNWKCLKKSMASVDMDLLFEVLHAEYGNEYKHCHEKLLRFIGKYCVFCRESPIPRETCRYCDIIRCIQDSNRKGVANAEYGLAHSISPDNPSGRKLKVLMALVNIYHLHTVLQEKYPSEYDGCFVELMHFIDVPAVKTMCKLCYMAMVRHKSPAVDCQYCHLIYLIGENIANVFLYMGNHDHRDKTMSDIQYYAFHLDEPTLMEVLMFRYRLTSDKAHYLLSQLEGGSCQENSPPSSAQPKYLPLHPFTSRCPFHAGERNSVSGCLECNLLESVGPFLFETLTKAVSLDGKDEVPYDLWRVVTLITRLTSERAMKLFRSVYLRDGGAYEYLASTRYRKMNMEDLGAVLTLFRPTMTTNLESDTFKKVKILEMMGAAIKQPRITGTKPASVALPEQRKRGYSRIRCPEHSRGMDSTCCDACHLCGMLGTEPYMCPITRMKKVFKRTQIFIKSKKYHENYLGATTIALITIVGTGNSHMLYHSLVAVFPMSTQKQLQMYRLLMCISDSYLRVINPEIREIGEVVSFESLTFDDEEELAFELPDAQKTPIEELDIDLGP